MTTPAAEAQPLEPAHFNYYTRHAKEFDEERVLLYSDALEHTIESGDVVVDARCGSGALALKACEYGAGRVYAYDIDGEAVRVTAANAARNGMDDKIVAIHADSLTVEVPEAVDVIIADLFETGLGAGSQMDTLQNLTKYLKKGGVILPANMNNYVGLITAQKMLYGLDFGYDLRHIGLKGDRDLTESGLYMPIDFAAEPIDKVDANTLVRATRSGWANAIKITHDMRFWPGGPTVSRSRESTSETLMRPLVRFLDKSTGPVRVERGKVYNIALQYVLGSIGAAGANAIIEITEVDERMLQNVGRPQH
jgi:precorrin-6B methylase 2